MRLRALSLALLIVLLAACDPLGPIATPTPTTSTSPATATVPPIADTPTIAADQPQPTDTTEATSEPTQARVGGTTTPSVVAEDSATAVATVSAELEQQLRQVESDTVQTRGLQPKRPVPATFLTPAQMKANLQKEVETEYTPEEAKRDANTLWLLRLIPDPKLDLRQLQIDLLGEQVLGYYSQKTKQLFVKSDSATLSPLSRETLAHEFTHSLQDQYYDLQKLQPEKGQENDQGNAVLSVVEGDATLSGLLYARSNMNPDDFQQVISGGTDNSTQVLDKAPAYIRDGLLFPYDQGALFVTTLLQQHNLDFSGVDAALTDPPKSTEQILHSEKYLNTPRDNPKPVTMTPLTDTLGAGWTFTETDTLGEFDLQELLKSNGVPDTDATPGPGQVTASQAAQGWGGARYDLYIKGSASLVLVETLWDTQQDATEFNSAMQESFQSLKKDGTLWTDGTRYFGLSNRADKVVFVASTDAGAVQRALDAAKP